MKGISIANIDHAGLRRLAEQLDQKTGIGDQNGRVTTAEVDKAIATAEASPGTFQNVNELRTLRTFLQHFGAEGDGSAAGPAAGGISAGGYNPITARAGNLTGQVTTNIPPLHLGEGRRIDVTARMFEPTGVDRNIPSGRSILFPLDPGKLHLVELRYHDNRPLKDLEFNYREKGQFNYTTFRGDQYFEMKAKEDRGEIEIKREPDHNGPWVNNPVRVKVEVLYPDGRVHDMGKKFIDFHVHDARSVNGSGVPETDNIYKRMPPGDLPPGCLMRLTPYFENKKPWEENRTTACEFHWVRPITVPPHKEKVRIRSSYRFEKPPAEGYSVDPNRKIAGVLVNWTDNGGTSRGTVSIQGDRGPVRSQPYNVGSGETELIPLDGYAKTGKLKVEGHGIEVANVDILYAE